MSEGLKGESTHHRLLPPLPVSGKGEKSLKGTVLLPCLQFPHIGEDWKGGKVGRGVGVGGGRSC